MLYLDGLEGAQLVLLDTRELSDPNRRRGVNRLGSHWTVLQSIAEHLRFPSWWQTTMSRISKLLSQRLQAEAAARRADAPPARVPPPLAIVTFCKKGRHRSVATAVLISHILSDLGWQVTTSRQMRPWWAFGACNECTACRVPPSLEILNYVRTMLRELPPRCIPWQ